jgi:hypothetical protein
MINDEPWIMDDGRRTINEKRKKVLGSIRNGVDPVEYELKSQKATWIHES